MNGIKIRRTTAKMATGVVTGEYLGDDMEGRPQKNLKKKVGTRKGFYKRVKSDPQNTLFSCIMCTWYLIFQKNGPSKE